MNLKIVEKMSARLGLLACGVVMMCGCTAEIGRKPFESDVKCLREQMGTTMQLSFPIAANTCQRMSDHNFVFSKNHKHPQPLPLKLRGAPDLQKMADEYGYSYTK
ncbi:MULTISPECIES: hypothetical protein [Komagataeibacter]|uniref:Lipoprotein n=2 Tax=Komagataeibacter TaxID=1434011 RepID=A0A318QZP5_9PROT|nr:MULTISPECIES: hypothetical protein [Komagataeibacter]GBR39900.1 hypothetical protein AA11826_2021 [Komagataeibacter oboediens DSM 11826]MBL7233844.1 hypothetical protein [Komagataeibacter oboediens]MBT0674805.1 hypothetical protein [Komagataeibacter oboediens]MBT0678647.1 hypothetical protein [Komagataeibacter oboediens]MBV0887707.1 hypothetical protein [Komagataeibacter oboediens]